MAIRLGNPAVLVAGLIFVAATVAMVISEELDVLLFIGAALVAALITGIAYGLILLTRGAAVPRRDAFLAALVAGLLLATPIQWDWGAHGDDTGWVALWETPRLAVVSEAAPLVPYVSDTLD
ncbi:MAG TPA: hypothetical protein VFX51_07770 [Solirubrobacteraceae bacterium]|nr:hypothetical protein [Solirubrobacteraceae bacterium]